VDEEKVESCLLVFWNDLVIAIVEFGLIWLLSDDEDKLVVALESSDWFVEDIRLPSIDRY
jgi:hypothetical protein